MYDIKRLITGFSYGNYYRLARFYPDLRIRLSQLFKIVAHIEEHYHVSFTGEEILNLHTPQELYLKTWQKIKAKCLVEQKSRQR